MNVLRVAQYRLLSGLGSGGAANVYLAEDTRLRRKVALKLLRGENGQDGEHEARVVSSISHPNIVTLLDYGTHNDLQYIVTEYVEGQTLRHRLAQGPLPVAEALDIAIAVGHALSAAHEAWIVHRDIKPENVMLRIDGGVKVLDFGVATLAAPAEVDDPLRRKVVGTLEYLSPEQVRGEPQIDSRSDLYSLGVLLFEMLVGSVPFHGATTMELLAAIVEEEAPSLPSHLPAALQPIVTKALRKPVHERYQLAGDFVAELSDLRLDLLLYERAARMLP
ncbi:MAG TPA: serine/threonine-protein kinase [Thermoanaerobaculia bacterium]